ncbi:unnamed protein product [Albugo candida]|uniref:Uncharacterized protein n=1 Tax=Albugo candida TaxID=65357 RepID=A0A024GKV8_9STRA|nr:unnamed protein product [Albugo candida]|eukprot:CCI47511.1 unnamed protein product [Albugo candida]
MTQCSFTIIQRLDITSILIQVRIEAMLTKRTRSKHSIKILAFPLPEMMLVRSDCMLFLDSLAECDRWNDEETWLTTFRACSSHFHVQIFGSTPFAKTFRTEAMIASRYKNT